MAQVFHRIAVVGFGAEAGLVVCAAGFAACVWFLDMGGFCQERF